MRGRGEGVEHVPRNVLAGLGPWPLGFPLSLVVMVDVTQPALFFLSLNYLPQELRGETIADWQG